MVTITNGGSGLSAPDYPTPFVANVDAAPGCTTVAGVEVVFPNPGKNVKWGGAYTNNIPTAPAGIAGSCAASAFGSQPGSPGSGEAPAPIPAPSSSVAAGGGQAPAPSSSEIPAVPSFVIAQSPSTTSQAAQASVVPSAAAEGETPTTSSAPAAGETLWEGSSIASLTGSPTLGGESAAATGKKCKRHVPQSKRLARHARRSTAGHARRGDKPVHRPSHDHLVNRSRR